MPYHFWTKVGSFGDSGTHTALLLSSKESLVNFKNKTFPQLLKLFRRLIQKLDSLKTTENSVHNQI